jgi:hypothetical protein
MASLSFPHKANSKLIGSYTKLTNAKSWLRQSWNIGVCSFL